MGGTLSMLRSARPQACGPQQTKQHPHSRVTLLSLTDRLPLTCTRLGTCCHGHRILVSPWELAWLAHGLGVTPRELRDARMVLGGTQLTADGPLGVHGPAAHRVPACTLYDSVLGCRAHQQRPLACRLYPLGRQRLAGVIRYHHPGSALPCLELCPTVGELPTRTVGDYLREQEITASEAAHDGYAALAYGLVKAALVISDAGLVDRAHLLNRFTLFRTWSGDQRAAHLPSHWYDLLTIPDLEVGADAAAFVAAHGQLLASRLHGEFMGKTAADALVEAAELDLLLALHLGSTVGTDPAVMATLVQGASSP